MLGKKIPERHYVFPWFYRIIQKGFLLLKYFPSITKTKKRFRRPYSGLFLQDAVCQPPSPKKLTRDAFRCHSVDFSSWISRRFSFLQEEIQSEKGIEMKVFSFFSTNCDFSLDSHGFLDGFISVLHFFPP